MLEAPPGSREDLVEAARTPCTPSELDTMLYGYTNGIYVLDHTPESLPDMDMLQLFASPAGRALVSRSATREERQQQQQHQHQQHQLQQQRSSTSTSSLGRELVSGLASGVASSPSSFSSTSTSSSSSATSTSASAAGSATSNRRPGTVSAPTSPPGRQRKSSTELYKEAVEILGLTCTLSDSCRCIDCQSNYFDYDDDYGEVRTELAAGTPILLDHALTHPLACSIQ